MTWKGAHVLVTGGASFIGSHLVDALVAKGAEVRVVDNLSSGRRENLAAHLERGAIDLVEGDLLDPGVADRALRGVGVVFHLPPTMAAAGTSIFIKPPAPATCSWTGLCFTPAGRRASARSSMPRPAVYIRTICKPTSVDRCS